MLINFDNVEKMGYLGWTIEEKFTKELKKQFPSVTDYTSKNLYNLYKAGIKQYSKIPSNSVDLKIFEDYMYNNSGISRDIIKLFLTTASTFISKGTINIKAINPNLTKSNWQLYVYPIITVAGLIAGAKLVTEYRRIKAKK